MLKLRPEILIGNQVNKEQEEEERADECSRWWKHLKARRIVKVMWKCCKREGSTKIGGCMSQANDFMLLQRNTSNVHVKYLFKEVGLSLEKKQQGKCCGPPSFSSVTVSKGLF